MANIAIRYHDFSAGHRVYGQIDPDDPERKRLGACHSLHGHNYRITFYCLTEKLDKQGMSIDFGVVKKTLCTWLDQNWDHRFLIWTRDPIAHPLRMLDPRVVTVPFNPTAEEMGNYLLTEIGPKLLKGTGAKLTCVRVSETRKCSALAF